MAMYFEWIYFYNKTIFYFAIVGVLITSYAVWKMFITNDFDETPAALHCDTYFSDRMNERFPPICPNMYQNIESTQQLNEMFKKFDDPELCQEAKISYIFDNYYSIWYVLLMTVWAASFLDFWKRRENLLQVMWGVEGTEIYQDGENFTRPNYRKVATKEESGKPAMNPVTLRTERIIKPGYKLKQRLLGLLIEGLVLFGFLCFTSLLILFNQQMKQATEQLDTKKANPILNKKVGLKIFTMFVKITLIQIVVFIHKKLVAPLLVKLEHHKTQAAYDQSLADKEFKFQWINYNFPIIYYAFIRKLIDTSPIHMRKLSKIGGDVPVIGWLVSNIFFMVEWALDGLRLNTGDSHCGQHMTGMCRGGSCVNELAFYLISLLTYNALIIGNFKEWIVPRVKRYFGIRRKVIIQLNKKIEEEQSCIQTFLLRFKSKEEEKRKLLPIEKDYLKADYTSQDLFFEYSKLVTNHGFAIQFLAVMPLGPFFIWILNSVEKKLDANKYLSAKKKTTPKRNACTSYWQQIMFNISVFSVFSNVFLLTITTDQIPRLMYTGSRLMNFSDVHLMNHWPVHKYGDDNETLRINNTWLNYFESTMTKVNLSCIAKFDHNKINNITRGNEFLYPQMFRRYYREEKINYDLDPENSFDEYIPAPGYKEGEKMCNAKGSFVDNFVSFLSYNTKESDSVKNSNLTGPAKDNYFDNYTDDLSLYKDFPSREASDLNNYENCEKSYNFKNYNHGQAYNKSNVIVDFADNHDHNNSCTWFMRKEKVYKDSDCCEMRSSEKRTQFAAARLLFILVIVFFNFGLQVIFRRMIPDKIGGVVKRRQIENAIKDIINEYVEDYDEALENGEGLLENMIPKDELKNLDSFKLTKEKQEKFKENTTYQTIKSFKKELDTQYSDGNQDTKDDSESDIIIATLQRRLSLRRVD